MRPFVRATLAVLFVLASLVASPAVPVVASCATSDLAEQVARADVIAFGTVTSIRMTLVAASGVVTFRPERVLKGSLTQSVQVYLGPTHGGAVSSVDYQAAPPQQHTLYLRDARDGSLETDACSGSHEGAPTVEEERSLGAGDVVPQPPSSPPLIVIAAVAAVTIALALTALVIVRRRPQ